MDERGYTGWILPQGEVFEEGYNLACILTLPPYQRKGYGKLLIAFSYELSKKKGKSERRRGLCPISVSVYRGYWTRELLALLADPTDSLCPLKTCRI